MNPVKRLYLRHLLRSAARLQRSGVLSDSGYGGLVVGVVFELAGRRLQPGEDFGLAAFGEAASKVFGEGFDYGIQQDPGLLRYGPLVSAPVLLRNAVSSFEWGTYAEGIYQNARNFIAPLDRFEAWAARVRKRYPTLTGLSSRLWWMILSAIVGGLVGKFVL